MLAKSEHPMQDIHPRYWIMIATLGFVAGSTFLLIELALVEMTPLWLASCRLGLAAGLLSIPWAIRGFKLFEDEADWISLVIVGLLSTALPFFLISWGQTKVTSAFTGVSMTAIALIILPLAHVFLPDEKMTTRKVFGFCLGFAGVALLFGGDAMSSTGIEREGLGRASIFGATLCYAVSSVMLRRMPKADAIGMTAAFSLIGTTVILPIAFTVDGAPPSVSQSTLQIVLLLGLVPTALAHLLRVIVVRGAGSTFMTLTNYQVPIWSVCLGAWVLNEPLPPSMIWAMLLILGGMGISQFGALQRVFKAR